MRLDPVIDDLAAQQHALVATWQLRALGLSDGEVLRLRLGDRWVPVSRRVLALRAGVDSGGEEWAGRVDFRDYELALVAEINSEKHHSSLVDKAADAARLARLEAAGLTVLVFWDTQVWHEPATVIQDLLEARRRLRSCRGASG